MFAILITGIIMASAAAIFWCLEAKLYMDAVQSTKMGKGMFKEVIYSARIMRCTPKLLPVVIDLFITIWLTGAFGFTGMIGSVIGLSVSNIISLFIIYYSKRKVN